MAGVEAAAAVVAVLEQATLMAKQLPNLNPTTNLEQSKILQIYSSLHAAHHHLSLFLSHHPPPLPFQPQPSFLPTLQPENSVSSAVGGGGDGNGAEPMQMGDDDDVEYHNSMTTSSAVAAAAATTGIDGVEERMRDCYIQNKRPKRSLSPSTLAEQRRSYANEVAARVGYSAEDFDPEGTKLRYLDLIYQFHG